ncbi:hypothetical protein LOD99_493 [Oopsacas minuta]|uniref:Uncharacterized protein n=1 Tax=Oopsacas minuta TaxID=111878 RepID=A0AAV7K9F1_9METZ|nr:hypothetical protein LOD99_493 [Oopsacas minuta]
MDVFIGTQTVNESADRLKTRNQFTFYQRFMKFLLRGGKKSLEFVTRDLVAKCHFYELLVALQGCVEEIISNYSNLTQEDSTSGVWPTTTSPRTVKESTTPFPSPVKGTNSQNSSANMTDKEVVSFKTEVTDKDDLDDVLWGGVEGGVKMEIETMDDSFTKELLEFQLEETDTKSQNKRIAYIEDSLAEKIISYLKKLSEQLEMCSDVLDTFPPTHQHTPYKETDPRSNLRYSLSNLVKLLRRRRFLESVLILLMCQNSQFSSKLFSSLRDVLFLLVRSQTGMLYMLEESDCINTMIRLLVPPDAPSHQIYLPIAEFSAESKCESCTPENLGYLIFYHLQVLQLVDEIRGLSLDLHKDGLIENNFLESECFRILHLLYTMTLAPLGKHTVVHVLSLEDNILPFLKIVDPPRDDRNNTYNIQNILSPSAQYVILLLKVLIHMSQSVDFVFRNLEQMVRLIDALKECEFGTLGVLHWIEIFKLFDKKDVPQEDKIGRVIKEIELSMDNFNLSHLVEIEPTLLTNIRILSHHLRGINKKDSTIALDSTITINYIVSSNGVYILTQLIHKITSILLPLWRHGLILKPSETFTLLSLTGNSVYILKLVLIELLSVEGMAYNNSLLLRSLFALYCLMTPQRAFLSDSACVRHIAVQVSGDIVDICAAYLTNKVMSPPPQEEDQKMDTETSEKDTSMTKEPQEIASPWSFLLKELFEFTLSAPQFFTGGTLLLSELLPIPLPVYIPEEVNSVVVMEYMKKMRGDWSCQLSAFTSECKTLIRSTAGTCCSELHTYVWKCACQIGDLSATLANAITNQLKELLCSQLEEDSLRKDLDKKLSGRSVYLLGTLAVVTQQASMKAAYLKCIKENFDALKILCDLITREPEICPHSGKLSILMILSSICNPYISLMVSTNESVLLNDYQVANGLPGHKELACIVSTLLRHVSMRNQSFSCLLLTLRTLANLSHHDQGMIHFHKYIVEEKTFRFFPVFENILVGLKLVDKSLLEDAIACVSLLIEFIGVLTISNFFQQDDKQSESSQSASSAPTVKKIYLPTHFINSELTQQKDYLQLVLDALIKESSLEQSGVEEFRNHILCLKNGLEVTNSDVVQNEALPEVRVENLEEQFDKRILFTVGHQFYFPEYWLPHCPYDQTQVHVDPVFLDLEKIAYETCSSYNLRDELNRLYHSSPSSVMDPNLARHMRMQSYLMSNTSDPQKKFGSITGSSLLSSSIIHKFQRRKQNTSRPPSLHVDDFVAREQASFPKQPSLIPRSPMTPFLISPIPGNLLSSHFPGRVPPGIPISTPVLATNPMIRSAWTTHIPPYPPALTSTLRPQSARIYPHHLDALHDTGPLNRSRFVRGDSIQSRSPSNFSAPRSRQRRDATKSCAKLLT